MFGSNRKDAAFFDAFVSHAKKSLDAAKMLVTLMDGLTSADALGGSERKSLAEKIKEAESAGDRITHETIKRLRENWITPLDRTDIFDLISRMDDVLDFIEEAADRVVLFEVEEAPAEAAALARILVRSCEALVKSVGLLDDMKNAPAILDLCVEVNSLENEADKVHRKAIADLFRKGNDPLTVMKWRDIFDSLESAADRCEDVANVVEGVVLEYA